jgi:hypothetical protein
LHLRVLEEASVDIIVKLAPDWLKLLLALLLKLIEFELELSHGDCNSLKGHLLLLLLLLGLLTLAQHWRDDLHFTGGGLVEVLLDKLNFGGEVELQRERKDQL